MLINLSESVFYSFFQLKKKFKFMICAKIPDGLSFFDKIMLLN